MKVENSKIVSDYDEIKKVANDSKMKTRNDKHQILAKYLKNGKIMNSFKKIDTFPGISLWKNQLKFSDGQTKTMKLDKLQSLPQIQTKNVKDEPSLNFGTSIDFERMSPFHRQYLNKQMKKKNRLNRSFLENLTHRSQISNMLTQQSTEILKSN